MHVRREVLFELPVLCDDCSVVRYTGSGRSFALVSPWKLCALRSDAVKYQVQPHIIFASSKSEERLQEALKMPGGFLIPPSAETWVNEVL